MVDGPVMGLPVGEIALACSVGALIVLGMLWVIARISNE